jgi:hypothetical protein
MTFIENCAIAAMQVFLQMGVSEEEVIDRSFSVAAGMQAGKLKKRGRKEKTFTLDSDIVDVLRELYEPCKRFEGVFVSISDLRKNLKLQNDSKIVGPVMDSEGFVSDRAVKDGVRSRGYWVKLIND